MSSYEEYEPSTHPWGPCIFLVAFLSIVVSFCSPYWLANDGELEEGHFLNTGEFNQVYCMPPPQDKHEHQNETESLYQVGYKMK